MHLLEIRDVDVSYGSVAALRDCSIHIDEGELVSIVGSNGAGKTTVCKMISGLLEPVKGSVLFEGKEITDVPSFSRVELGIIQAPEGRHLFPAMTVYENLQMGAFSRRARGEAKKNTEYVYELFPRLYERRKQDANTLSGGEQQMLAIGRAIMSIPKLLILDEPSLGLSPINVQLIFEKLDEIRATGTTVLLVEQNVEKALRKSSRAYVLENGRIVMSGAGAELLENENLKKAYLGI